ncbi:capsule biosynthesis protein [Clostridium massiliodielmoense]|uniref:capsule biosynthesis protein n=1 Tax=Clostridium massiliodielmoense TaxID=1776385 RepID=UPI0004D8929A|nr:capsule biosynthesis protein [Clostridium massiliodielmoense]KEH98033.1 capsule biosynthesis protein [Clostridium botulinum C/D str. BKT12695]
MIGASDILLDIERKFKLFDLELREFRFWWMSRYKIYELIRNIITNKNKVSSGDTKILNLKKSLSNFKYLKSFKLGKNKYSHSDILCVSGTTLRRQIVEKKYFDVIFDFIGKYDKNNSYAILNTLSGNGFIGNHYTPECYNMSNLTLANHFVKKTYKFVLKPKEIKYIEDTFKKVENYLKQEYNINLDLCKIVCGQTAILLENYNIAFNIVKRVSPKVLYVECAYSPTHLLFVYVAKNLNIPVVEFQHGLISDKHIGYKYNKETYKVDPVPDYICVYGSYFGEIIQKMNPDLDLNIIKYGNILLYEEVSKEYNRYDNKTDNTYDYLVTTQGEEFSKYWNIFLKRLLEIDKNSKILLKVHPNEIMVYKQLYGEVLSNSRVTFAENYNIYDCLKMSKKHLSCFSTCHYEALVYNVPTYVIKFPGWEHVNKLEHYNVGFFNTADEFISYIKEEKNNILFNKFKKDFFDIDSDKIDIKRIQQKIVGFNNLFTKSM